MKTPQDLVAAAKARIQEVPLSEAEDAIREADALIDVREESEFAAGHIPGAIHASRGMLEFKLAGNPALQARDVKVVLYCKTSGRAALAAAWATSMCGPSPGALTAGWPRASRWPSPACRRSADHPALVARPAQAYPVARTAIRAAHAALGGAWRCT